MTSSHGSFSRWIFALAGLCALWLTWYVPPFQSPDETVHLWRADMISRGQFFLTAETVGGTSGGYIDANLQRIATRLAEMPPIAVTPAAPPAAQVIAEELHSRWSGKLVFQAAAGTGYYFPLIYLPHAAALFAGRQLDWSILHTYMLVRVVVVVAAFVLACAGLSIYMPNPLAMACLMTPMALFQWLSSTIDGLSFGLALLLLALWSKMRERALPKSPWLPWSFYAVLLLLASTRTNLIVLAALPLITYFKTDKIKAITTTALISAILLAWTAIATHAVVDDRVVRAQSTLQIAELYLVNPMEFLSLMDRTLHSEKITWYLKSFFGYFGWLTIPLSKSATRDMSRALLLMSVLLVSINWRWRQPVVKSMMIVLALLSCVLVFLALAISWNLYPANVIEGIQGRYFIIPAFFLASALGPVGPRSYPYRWFEVLLLGLFAAYSVHWLTKTLTTAYQLPVFPFGMYFPG